VPQLTPVYETSCRKYFKADPLIVSSQVRLAVQIEVSRPEEIGADRLANASAGFVKFGGPVIVVDFGTATTFDVVDRRGVYIGGVIAPGPETSLAELARKAARLFEVRIERPQSVVGKSTAGALKSGLFYGTLGQVDFIIDRIVEEAGLAGGAVVATGGLAHGFETLSRHITTFEQTLTLEGLRIIHELN
jgi:type III pantothenate kinase